MGLPTLAGAAYRALTARKKGPSLYDICDPLLLKYRGGDAHLGQFYRTSAARSAVSRPSSHNSGSPVPRNSGRSAGLPSAVR